ncbi:MAG: peptidoglycan DD-metalloendopeptidase family protein [Flavobacteriales bacterium]|jgi:murein DD-endopeptidase MepM/ murein hydrolase activator NlpD|tara:strand:- start:1700 stop:2671 length:972 start_codon:yes stop_codon:yes gene_type:complete
MDKNNFKFNDKTLEYEKVEVSFLKRLKKAGLHLGVSVVLALIIIIVSYPLITRYTEKEKNQEIEKLQETYSKMNQQIQDISNELEVLKMRDDSIYSGIFGVSPVSKSLRIGGTGGTDEFDYLRGYDNSDLMLQSAQLVKSLENQLKIHKKGFDRIDKLAHTRSEKLSHIPAVQPIHNHNLIRVASGFGMRMHPVYNVPKMHYGIDFTAKTGTDIYATGDGKVERVRKSYSGYGKHVIINHGFGYKTLYAHMHDFSVKQGQKVKRGDIIGQVGNTGTSTGPHLHYEVIRNNKKIDPTNFFFNDLNYEQYQEMIKISSQIKTSLD